MTAFQDILTPIIQVALTAIATAVTGLLALYVPRAIAAFETRTGIQLTAQQQATVMGAAQTGAGLLETMLDKGAIALDQVSPTNPAILGLAKDALARVPVEAVAMDKSVASMAATIVGLADTTPTPLLPTVTANAGLPLIPRITP